MPHSFRPVVALFFTCLLGPVLSADEGGIKWSPWRPIDERFNPVRIRTSLDDNGGRGWGDGKNHWRIEIKNNFVHSTVQLALEFARWNPRTRMWDPPAAPRPPGFDLDPGEVHEDAAVGESKTGFDYRYLITLVPPEGKSNAAPRTATGFANSRIVPKLIAESSLVTQAAFSKAMAEERKISAADPATAAPAAAATPVAAPPAEPAKPAAPTALAPAALPAPAANAAPLPQVSVEGLGATERFSLWQQRATQGDVNAMFELGRAYRMGDGTAQDHALATEWYRQAANRGSVAAMTKLGYAYDSGLGVDRDAKTAIDWWKKAAALGDAEAAKKLSKLGVAP